FSVFYDYYEILLESENHDASRHGVFLHMFICCSQSELDLFLPFFGGFCFNTLAMTVKLSFTHSK
ncbi:hypothetical protein ALC57_07593, partial [Trachymyrmex cornetzi]